MGASGVILLAIMLGGGVLLWLGVPVGWLWVGSRVQAGTDSIGAAIGVMMVGAVVSIILIVLGLAWLNNKHLELREDRGEEGHGTVALEAVMTVSAVIAVVAFGIWFFVIEGPGPSLAPSN